MSHANRSYRCTWGGKFFIVRATNTREAAEQTWVQLGAPDVFCVDVKELAILPPFSEDVTDVDDLLAPLFDPDPTVPGHSW